MENKIPSVLIVMGSTSDLSVMEKAAEFLNEMKIPFEIHVLSAHRTPDEAANLSRNAAQRGAKIIIAGAGGAAHLPGVLAAFTTLPVIGVPVKSSNSIDGWDSILSILQMPSGIPVATMALDGAKNAAIFATQILATSDKELQKKLIEFKNSSAKKVLEAANEIAKINKFQYKIN